MGEGVIQRKKNKKNVWYINQSSHLLPKSSRRRSNSEKVQRR